jgi:hypothetical protein
MNNLITEKETRQIDLAKEAFSARQVTGEIDLAKESFPNRKGHLPTDGVFRYGELFKADIRGADLSGYYVEEKNGNVIKIEDLILTEDQDRINEVTKGAIFQFNTTRFSKDNEQNKKLMEIFKVGAIPWDGDKPEGNDYSHLKLEASVLPTSKSEYASLNEFFCIEDNPKPKQDEELQIKVPEFGDEKILKVFDEEPGEELGKEKKEKS